MGTLSNIFSYSIDNSIDTSTEKIVYSKKFVYKGNKNKSDFPEFINLLKMSQLQIKLYLMKQMKRYYDAEDIINKDGFLYMRGRDPVCLVAHIDTTPTVDGKSRIAVIDYYEDITEDDNGNIKHILTSPQGIGGDDRCGIWTILNILDETDYLPYIVFCEDEEIGCIGSSKFAKTEYVKELKNYCKFIVEIDRRGNNDIVFYEDENYEFHEWVANVTGYKEAIGSCSDIIYLSEGSDISSVNISSGYYDEHTLEESIVVEETLHTKDAVIKLIQEGVKDEVEQFVYITYPKYKYNSLYYFGDKDEDEDYIYGYGNDDYETVVGYFYYMGEDGELKEVSEIGGSKVECIGYFFVNNPNVCWSDLVDMYFEEDDYLLK